jgi:hypothetical protein
VEKEAKNNAIKSIDTGNAENTGTAGKQEGKSNFTPELKISESKNSPFRSYIWVIAAFFGEAMYFRKRK